MRARLAAGLLVAALAGGCGGTPPDVAEPAGVKAVAFAAGRDEAGSSGEDVRRLTAAQLEFAVDLYRSVSREVPGDLVLGPGSLHTALAMIRAGARGRTAAEMDAVLRADRLDGRLHELGNALDAELRSRSSARAVEVDLANRVWVDRDVELLQEYLDVLEPSYGAALAELDLSGDPEGSRAAINAWVAEATRDKIEELFPEGALDNTTALVLVNALYLEASWRFPFPADRTVDQPFRLADGSAVPVPTMQYDLELPSGRGEGWAAVRLPYSGEQLSMTVVVPDDLAAFERRLSPELLGEVDAAIADGGIHLSLPRFTARTHLSLAGTLAQMGMPSAFGDADLSGMTGAHGLYLGAVEHEAVVEVDEEGTEAAAASGGVVAGSHGPTVTVDRPFLFVIRDEPTGAVLFLGRVTDPR